MVFVGIFFRVLLFDSSMFWRFADRERATVDIDAS